MANWAAIPEYKSALEGAMGADGAAEMDRQVSAQLGAFNAMAERIYINWMQTSAQA